MIGTIPFYDRKGCYALFSDSELLYVGVAAEATLAARLSGYTRVAEKGFSCADRPYKPVPDLEAKGLNRIYTLCFPDERSYLASALEKYLIRKLQPRENIHGK